jgi:beta-glucanase (GH16 family)
MVELFGLVMILIGLLSILIIVSLNEPHPVSLKWALLGFSSFAHMLNFLSLPLPCSGSPIDATNDMEYYDPRGASTAGGYLVLNMTEQDPEENHGFNYSSGMIQTWNQFCFTGGYIEVAVNLPGSPHTAGFWREL